MLKGKRIIIVSLSTAALLGGLFVVFSGHGQSNQQNSTADPVAFGQSAKQLDDAAAPVVDLSNVSEVDRVDKNARKLKNARHDKSGTDKTHPYPNVSDVVGEPEWRSGYSDLPVDKSDVVVEAVVADSRAFLSEDKTGIYSEFTLIVSKILKVGSGLTINLGDRIVTERFGGKVRYPSGQVTRWRIARQGVPIIGKKYLFFLAKLDEDSYQLLTAYEIRGSKIVALDGSRTELGKQGGSIFDKHNGKDLSQFMEEVEMAINNSHSRSSKP
ncbi:MAG: hypothetical protein ACXW18_09845 [Pyrinomonadaceae bacterium]